MSPAPNPTDRRPLRIALAVWAGTIFLLSVLPLAVLGPQPFDLSDKAVHAAFYLPLGALCFWTIAPRSKFLSWAQAAGAAALYGLLMELIQLALPWRSFDCYDAAANLAGAAVGAALALLFPALPALAISRFRELK